jgi:hypothetical protein
MGLTGFIYPEELALLCNRATISTGLSIYELHSLGIQYLFLEFKICHGSLLLLAIYKLEYWHCKGCGFGVRVRARGYVAIYIQYRRVSLGFPKTGSTGILYRN